MRDPSRWFHGHFPLTIAIITRLGHSRSQSCDQAGSERDLPYREYDISNSHNGLIVSYHKDGGMQFYSPYPF